MKTLVVLSGHIASGKTSLALALGKLGFNIVKTRDFLEGKTRAELQQSGEAFDRRDPEWLSNYVIGTMAVNDHVLVDAVRRQEQLDSFRRRLPGVRVFHIHMEASAEELTRRYRTRNEVTPFDRAISDVTEEQVDTLRATADLVINTSRCDEQDALTRALARLGLRRNNHAPLVDVLIGAQYGSEGKGHIVSYIAPEYNVLIRTGGANAGHTVLVNGRPVIFKLLPSGTLHRKKGARVLLGPGMNIDVDVLLREIELAGLTQHDLMIDPQAWIVREDDKLNEQTAEAFVEKIGSTKQGVGEATARRIRMRGSASKGQMAGDIHSLEPFLGATLDILEDAYQRGEKVLLEGTQGTGLSLFHGPYPFVTSRDTTAAGVMSEAGIPPKRINRVIMVTRTNPIRVASPQGGSSGPMKRELSWEEVSARAKIPADVLREKERTSTTHRLRRIAEFDWSLLSRAASLNGPTDIALTFVDYIDHQNTEARRFEQLTEETRRFIEEIESVAGCPVSLITTRFHERSIIDRRSW